MTRSHVRQFDTTSRVTWTTHISYLLEIPVLHVENPVDIVAGSRIMGGQQDCTISTVGDDVTQDLEDHVSIGPVELASRFIGEHDSMTASNRTGDPHPLSLTPRHLSRASICQFSDPHLFESIHGNGRRIFNFTRPQDKLNILTGRKIGDEPMMLKNHPHFMKTNGVPS